LGGPHRLRAVEGFLWLAMWVGAGFCTVFLLLFIGMLVVLWFQSRPD
jgi:hypothetical protein